MYNGKHKGKFLWMSAMILIIIGAINWGLVGAFGFNLVSAIFGEGSALEQIIYVLVGLAGLWKLYMFFGHRRKNKMDNSKMSGGKNCVCGANGGPGCTCK